MLQASPGQLPGAHRGPPGARAVKLYACTVWEKGRKDVGEEVFDAQSGNLRAAHRALTIPLRALPKSKTSSRGRQTTRQPLSLSLPKVARFWVVLGERRADCQILRIENLLPGLSKRWPALSLSQPKVARLWAVLVERRADCQTKLPDFGQCSVSGAQIARLRIERPPPGVAKPLASTASLPTQGWLARF